MRAVTSMEQLRKKLPAVLDEAKARSVEFEERRAISPDFAATLKALNPFNLGKLCRSAVTGIGPAAAEVRIDTRVAAVTAV